jgi:hypothetical protein
MAALTPEPDASLEDVLRQALRHMNNVVSHVGK